MDTVHITGKAYDFAFMRMENEMEKDAIEKARK